MNTNINQLINRRINKFNCANDACSAPTIYVMQVTETGILTYIQQEKENITNKKIQMCSEPELRLCCVSGKMGEEGFSVEIHKVCLIVNNTNQAFVLEFISVTNHNDFLVDIILSSLRRIYNDFIVSFKYVELYLIFCHLSQVGSTVITRIPIYYTNQPLTTYM